MNHFCELSFVINTDTKEEQIKREQKKIWYELNLKITKSQLKATKILNNEILKYGNMEIELEIND